MKQARERDAASLGDVLESLESELEARGQSRWKRLVERVTSLPAAPRRALLFALAVGLPAFALGSPRGDWRAAIGVQLLAFGTCLVVVAWPLGAHASRGWHESPLSPWRTSAWLLGTLLLVTTCLALPPSHVLPPHTHIPEGASLLQHLAPCLAYGLGFALPVYAVGRLLGRGSPHGRLFAAASAGVSGNLALLLHCPITDPAHLLPAHGSVLALLLAGTWLWTRLRRARALAPAARAGGS